MVWFMYYIVEGSVKVPHAYLLLRMNSCIDSLKGIKVVSMLYASESFQKLQ